MIKFTRALLTFISAAFLSQNSLVDAAGFDPSGYALYSETSSLSLVNISSSNITGAVRSELSTCTFNNLSSISITGNVVCKGALRFNNISSGTVTGNVQSQTSVSVPSNRPRVTGTSTVVNSIGSLVLNPLAAPSSTSDDNYLQPITIVTGDYTINSARTLSGTIYATGDIHITNGSLSGTGSIVAGGSIHFDNLSSVGTSGAKMFLYARTGDIHINNVSTATIRGTLYAPAGTVHLNNISTVNVTGGVFADTIDLNNISNLTLGPGSAMTDATPPGIPNPVTIPAAPSNLTATAASYTAINLAWVDNSTNESSFRIERSTDGVTFSEIASVSANVVSYSDSGLASNQTWYYRVRARNSAGDSAYTNIANATLLSPPNSPSGLVAAAASSTAVNLSWTDNASNEASFRIERGIDGISFVEVGSVSANVSTYSDTGLASDTTYYYRVRARNSAGDSAYSNTADTSLVSIPTAPSALVATANGESEIDLSWRDNSSNETYFLLERSSDNVSFTQIVSLPAGTISYNDTALASGTYYYRVRASNSAGNSAYSNVAYAVLGTTSDPCDVSLSDSGYNSSSTYVATAELCGLLIR